jgi:hypothetical protein
MINFKDKRTLRLSFVITILFISGYFIYMKFSLTEQDARNTSKRLFNMLMMENVNKTELHKLYPSIEDMTSWAILKNPCHINNISKNSDGDYEVYATYKSTQNTNYSIFLLVGGTSNSPIIKSSKGLNYAYFDKVFEYGKKIGLLTGEEDDVELGNIIFVKSIREELQIKAQDKFKEIKSNLKITSNIVNYSDYVSGGISIINNNNIVFEYPELEFKIDFFDNNNQIIFSKNEPILQNVGAYGSYSTRIFEQKYNSTRYRIIPVINSNTIAFTNKVKDLIIQEAVYR